MDWMSERRPRFRDGLLPVVVQDADSGSVLMLAWANEEALAVTERTEEAHFWSRSRSRLWRKGEISGDTMHVVEIGADCDADAILYRVHPTGAACHTGTRTCFGEASPTGTLGRLEATINARRGADPAGSYTAALLLTGPRRPAEKLVEEAGEAAAASLAGTDEEVTAEAADLLYHLLVLLAARRIPLDRVLAVLGDRRSAAPPPG